jgi:RNA polymerase sigma factor (sigma-70 family)
MTAHSLPDFRPAALAAAVPSASDTELSWRTRRDLALIQAALAGQNKAYEALLELYQKSVFHVVLRIVRDADDAQDLTQEAFTKAFRNLMLYTPQFAFSTWVFRIATNHSIDFLRRKKIKTRSIHAGLYNEQGDTFTLDVPDQDPNPQEAYMCQQRRELLQRLVAKLAPRYARVVRMRYFEELTYEEIAAQLQLPLGTVKGQTFRARELLLELIKNSKAAI